MTIKVEKDQNLIDVAVNNYGSAWIPGLLELIRQNDVNLAAALTPGQELEVKNVNENDLSLRYLKSRGVRVATGNYSPPLPATPSDLAAAIISDTQNQITWTDNADNETGFEIWRAESEDGEFELIATLGENVTEYIDDNI